MAFSFVPRLIFSDFTFIIGNLYKENFKNISIFHSLRLKEILEKKEGNILTIEGKILHSPRQPYLLKLPPKSHACPVCSTNLDIKHTDVLILSQFVRSDGNMLPRRITGLCRLQQKRISTMVTMAQKAGLMYQLGPPSSKKDPTRRPQWKKYNTYFDENTIKPPRPRPLQPSNLGRLY